MRNRSLVLLLAAGLTAVIGCGGGGGGSNNSTSGSTGTTIPAGTVFGALDAGEVRTYSVTGTVVEGSVTNTISEGQRQVFVDADTTAGSQYRLSTVDSYTYNTTDGEAFLLREYVSQDSASNVTVRAVDFDSTLKTLTLAQSLIPGTWTAGTVVSNSPAYVGGGSATYSFTIQPLTTITVPLGTYQVYPVSLTINYGSGYSRSGTYYYAPQLAAYVRANETTVAPSATATIVASLTGISG